VRTLDRVVYSETDAARILHVVPATLHWWLDGGTRRRKTYPPVLRPEPTGTRSLTWAEFVEAGLLRSYHRNLRSTFNELRRFVELLREQTGVTYPLAHHQPWVGEGQRLVLEQQRQADLPENLWLVTPTGQSLTFTAPAETFLRHIQWDVEGEFVARWRPHPESPVWCDPLVRYGRPAIRGISTEVLDEHLRAGEDETAVADQYDLDVEDVRWAQAFELSQRAASKSA
jgi:uncharacterized protein (DUF433 family)